MKRLTWQNYDMCQFCVEGACCEHYYDNTFPVCDDKTIYDRLAAIEDILGDEYELERLRELVQADREGRCVVLPAKVDETVYQVKKGDDCPYCFRLEGVNISEDGVITYPMYWGESFVLNDFGTNLFRTYGEAIAALRREQDG